MPCATCDSSSSTAPGPQWKQGVPVFEQDGVGAHVEHYRAWLDADRLEMGGPFVDAAAGGMMICAAGSPEDAIRAHARADPAFAQGVMCAELFPYRVALWSAQGPAAGS